MSQTLLIVGNEIYKRLFILWAYKFNIVMQVLTVAFIFLGASYFIENGQLNPAPLASILLGYMVWFYARVVIMSSSEDLMGEAQAGTLEQMYMSPVSASLLLLGRMIAMLISTTVIVVVPMTILALVLGIRIPLRWEELFVLGITLAGLFGFTLALSGCSLIFKHIESLADLIQNLLLFLTGSLLPVSHFPQWLTVITQTLPITQGIIVLREVALNQQTLVGAWHEGSLNLLCINAAGYLLVGVFIFKWGEHISKVQGSLGHY